MQPPRSTPGVQPGDKATGWTRQDRVVRSPFVLDVGVRPRRGLERESVRREDEPWWGVPRDRSPWEGEIKSIQEARCPA